MQPVDTVDVGEGKELMEALQGVVGRCVRPSPRTCVPLCCGTGHRCRRARMRSTFLARGVNTSTRCRDGSASGSRHSVREPSVQAAADRRTERSDSDILVAEYHKVGESAGARESAGTRWHRVLLVSAACRSPPPPRACSLFVESQTTWNAEREGGAYLDPAEDLGFRV